MSRDPHLYLGDIAESCRRVTRYTQGVTKEAFLADTMRFDAVLRNIEIIGEAAKKVPPEIRAHLPQIEWPKIAGMRDWLAHAYFAVNSEIVWDLLQHHIPPLHQAIAAYLGERHASDQVVSTENDVP